MPSSTPPSGTRDLGAPLSSATPTRLRPSQVPEAGPPTTIKKETDSTPHNNLEDLIQNPYTNQQPSTGDAATTHTLQQTSTPDPHARHHANPQNDDQQSSGSDSDSDSDENKNNPNNDPNIRRDYHRQRKAYLLRLRRSQRQPQPSRMNLLTNTLSTLTTTDAPAPTLNPREANPRRLHRENAEKLARQRARNREMHAERAARRRRDVERRIQSGENLAGGEGAGAGAGGLGIADDFNVFDTSILG